MRHINGIVSRIESMEGNRRIWVIGGGVGCALVVGFACYMLVVFAVVGFNIVRGTAGFFLSPTQNSERFLEAIADNDLRKALRFVHPSAATDVDELQEMLPEGMLNIASVGDETYSRFAGNGDGNIRYRVTMDNGATAEVGLSMDIRNNEWLVSSIGIYDDE